MKKNRKKQILILLLLMCCMLSIVITFGRYVSSDIVNFFVRSKEFYFNADKLSENTSIFQIDNWSGVDSYTINVAMDSRKNNIEAASYDIPYDISCSISNNAIYQLSKTSGIISRNSNSDSFNVIVTPNTVLNEGDRVVVEITATARGDYKKIIKGRFTLVVGKEQLSYEITDSVKSPYCNLRLTNTLSGYTNVNIEFDPQDVLLDITNENYDNFTNIQYETINGKNYIKEFQISIEPISSIDIRFYKVDVNQNYSYHDSNDTCIIDIT